MNNTSQRSIIACIKANNYSMFDILFDPNVIYGRKIISAAFEVGNLQIISRILSSRRYDAERVFTIMVCKSIVHDNLEVLQYLLDIEEINFIKYAPLIFKSEATKILCHVVTEIYLDTLPDIYLKYISEYNRNSSNFSNIIDKCIENNDLISFKKLVRPGFKVNFLFFCHLGRYNFLNGFDHFLNIYPDWDIILRKCCKWANNCLNHLLGVRKYIPSSAALKNAIQNQGIWCGKSIEILHRYLPETLDIIVNMYADLEFGSGDADVSTYKWLLERKEMEPYIFNMTFAALSGYQKHEEFKLIILHPACKFTTKDFVQLMIKYLDKIYASPYPLVEWILHSVHRGTFKVYVSFVKLGDLMQHIPAKYLTEFKCVYDTFT